MCFAVLVSIQKKNGVLQRDISKMINMNGPDEENITAEYNHILQTNKVLQAGKIINQSIMHEKNRTELIQNTCSKLTKTDICEKAWIVLLDEKTLITDYSQSGQSNFKGFIDQVRKRDFPECFKKVFLGTGLQIFGPDQNDRCSCRLCTENKKSTIISTRLEFKSKIYGVFSIVLSSSFDPDKQVYSLFSEIADLISFYLYSIGLEEERSSTEYALMLSEAKLRKLAVSILEAEEEDKKKLARDLHDQIGQNLSALGINLSALREINPEQLNDAYYSRIDDSIDILVETTAAIRNVMSDLRPQVLDDYGLNSAIKWFGAKFQKRNNINFHFSFTGKERRLPEDTEINIFRIFQEAMNNIQKHSGANDVFVDLSMDETSLALIIKDNGNGFTVNGKSGTTSWGLINMKERALSINAGMDIVSQPDAGTTIRLEMG